MQPIPSEAVILHRRWWQTRDRFWIPAPGACFSWGSAPAGHDFWGNLGQRRGGVAAGGARDASV